MNYWALFGCFACYVIGIIFGIIYTNHKKKQKWIATVVIDPVNPEINGGVYMVWEKDPHKMVNNKEIKNNQIIQVNVLIADVTQLSQQNQGT